MEILLKLIMKKNIGTKGTYKIINENTSKAEISFRNNKPILHKDKLARFEPFYILANHLKFFRKRKYYYTHPTKTTKAFFGIGKAQRVENLNSQTIRSKEELLK